LNAWTHEGREGDELVDRLAYAIHSARTGSKRGGINASLLPSLRTMARMLLTECHRCGINVSLSPHA
jgi:hypothetical protein